MNNRTLMQSDWNYLKKTIQDVPNITLNLNQEVVKGKNQQGRGHSTSIFIEKERGKPDGSIKR